MEPEKATQFRFQDEQKTLLTQYWEKGMQCCSKSVAAMIDECAIAAKCSVEQVKHWINAEQKRRRRNKTAIEPSSLDDNASQKINVCRSRKRSAFQVFCHDASSSITGEGTSKITQLSEKWAAFSDVQKAEYKAKASEGMTWVSTLDQKKKVVRELIAITEENLKSLATLGVEGYAVLLNVANSDCRLLYGSDVAQDYVDTEEEKGQALDDMFFKYMCGQSYITKKKKKCNSYDEMLSTVRLEFKQKYRDVTGIGRIPYGNLSKLGCIIYGLPEGIEFKQPKEYSSCELRMIVNCLKEITFHQIADINVDNITTERETIAIEHEDEEGEATIELAL